VSDAMRKKTFDNVHDRASHSIKKSKYFLFSMTGAIVRTGMVIEKHENSKMARLGKLSRIFAFLQLSSIAIKKSNFWGIELIRRGMFYFYTWQNFKSILRYYFGGFRNLSKKI